MCPEEEKNGSQKTLTCVVCGKVLVEVNISTITDHPRTYSGMPGTVKVLKCPECGLLYDPCR